MARPYISPDLRRLVAQRADGLCECCLISERDRHSEHFRIEGATIQPLTELEK